MYKVCVKYGLDVHVKDILNGKIISNAAWKILVNCAIMERENTMWSIIICLYSSLRLYRRVIPMIGLCHWWQLADTKPHLRQCCQSVVQAITGGCVYHSRNPKVRFNKCILCCGEIVSNTFYIFFLSFFSYIMGLSLDDSSRIIQENSFYHVLIIRIRRFMSVHIKMVRGHSTPHISCG